MLSFKDYFILEESVQSVELMSNITGEEPLLDRWIKEYNNSGSSERLDLASYTYFLNLDYAGRFLMNRHEVYKIIKNLKIFKSPNIIKTIIKKATMKVPENFRIILNDVLHINTLEHSKKQRAIIQPTEGVITLVISPANDNITTWMISHKIGHQITDIDNFKNSRIIEKFIIEYINLLSSIGGIEPYKDGYYIDYSKLSNFRSARTHNITGNSIFEYINELIAQYLHTGRIKFIFPEELNNVEEEVRREFLMQKERIENEITEIVTNGLKSLVGRVFFDI